MKCEQFDLHADIEERHWWFVARRRILREVVATILPPSRQTTIVDVGCGTGANLAALADDYNCVGIDTSSDAIRLASERFGQAHFVCGNAFEMQSILASANLIMLNDVLEHVQDDFRMLAELVSCANPGCHFLITVPADMNLWSEHDKSFGHFRRYSKHRLEQVWFGLPVHAMFVSHFNARLYPVVRAVRSVSQWRGKSAGRAGTDFNLPRPVVNGLLERVFAGERRVLRNLAEGRQQAPYRRGVSLMAVLRRKAGKFNPQSQPGYVSSDSLDSLSLRDLAAV
jgi:2-polyprenyl-3-methyl-5-hydroxy-6-metoxy-1,4-benzoquinol methylase